MNYKELFRKFAIEKGMSHDCVIDKDTYAEISCVSGCFQKGSNWIVYDVDERGKICDQKIHSSPLEAYADLASRFGFKFETK